MRLMEGAEIYRIAKNCRTSVEMIEKFYAAHIKTSLDAAAINRRKSKARKAAKAEADSDGAGPQRPGRTKRRTSRKKRPVPAPEAEG